MMKGRFIMKVVFPNVSTLGKFTYRRMALPGRM